MRKGTRWLAAGVIALGLGYVYMSYNAHYTVSPEFREEIRERVDEQTVLYFSRAFAYEQVASQLRARDASLMRLFSGDADDFNEKLRMLEEPFTSRAHVLEQLGYDPIVVQEDLDLFMASSWEVLEDDEPLEFTPAMRFLATDTSYEFSLTSDGLFMVTVTNRSHFGVDRGVLFFDMMGNELSTVNVFRSAEHILNNRQEVNIEHARAAQPPSLGLDLVLATSRYEVEALLTAEGLSLEDIMDMPHIEFDPLNFIRPQSLVQIITDDIRGVTSSDTDTHVSLNTTGIIGLRDITEVDVHKIGHNHRGVQQGSNYVMNLLATLRSPQGNEHVVLRVICYGTRVVSYTIERIEVR